MVYVKVLEVSPARSPRWYVMGEKVTVPSTALVAVVVWGMGVPSAALSSNSNSPSARPRPSRTLVAEKDLAVTGCAS